jgi:hypothetical protein
VRLLLALVLAVVVLGLLLLARATPRASEVRTSDGAESSAGSTEAELAAPGVADVAEASDDTRAASVSRERAERPRERNSAAAVAPIRGRVVIAGTDYAVEAVLSVRLRTLDLLRSESLVTRPDGSFEGKRLFPRTRVLALVKDPDGRELVDHEALFDPTAEGDWLVPVPAARWPTFATGRVVDRRGTPLDNVRVSLVGLEEGLGLVECRSVEAGFKLENGLRPGRYRLLLQGAFARAQPCEVAIRAGPNDLGDRVLAEPAPAGDLCVHFVDEERRWPQARFELRSEGDGRVQPFDCSDAKRRDDLSFEVCVPGLPAGRYALAVRALDGRTYESASLTVSPPATVEVRVHGAEAPETLFRAHDAATGEALSGFEVDVSLGRTWTSFEASKRGYVGKVYMNQELNELSVPPGYDSWVLFASDHRAVSGSFAGASATIDVALEPGWSDLLQFEDAAGEAVGLPDYEHLRDAPVLAGVQVLIDGALAGVSGDDGLFAASCAHEPDTIEYRRPGWRVVREDFSGQVHRVLLVQTP